MAMKIPVLFTFDLDGESSFTRKREDYVQITRGLYGVKTGLKRVLNILSKYGIKSTFFVAAYVAEKHFDEVKEIANSGHEIALHGYLHEDFSQLMPSDANKVLEKSIAILSKIQNPIEGFRAPYWRIHKWLLKLLVEKKIVYDSSLMDSDEAYIVDIEGKPLVEIPISYQLDDWVLFEDHQYPPDLVLRTWIYDLEWSLEENVSFVLTMHPQVIGRRSRSRVLEQLLKLAKKMEKAAIITCREYAEQLLKIRK
ncbi:MAG: polysaccharide deacetylase [Thermoprotei archaeon]|nr:MAG: polysaccharide deacetylase [Thermoprotei archaeon]